MTFVRAGAPGVDLAPVPVPAYAGFPVAARVEDVATPRRPQRRSLRAWAVDLSVFAGSVIGGLVLLGTGVDADPPPDALAAADLATGLLACGLLWLRRRWPVGVSLALLPAACFSDTAGIAILVALFTVAVHRPPRVTALVTAANVAAALAYVWLRPDPDLPWQAGVAVVLLITAGVVAWGMFVGARRQLVASLRERATWVEAEQERRDERARTLERTRIAREMHDVLAHRISLVSMHAGALQYRPDASPGELSRAAGVVRESAHQALQDLREVIGVLRADPPEAGNTGAPQPTLAALCELVTESRRAGLRVTAEVQVADLAQVPTSLGRSAYRIVQEGLTNVRKHAPGAMVTVRVEGSPGGSLVLQVANGPAAPMAQTFPGVAAAIPGAGTGLIGLGERAMLVGGTLQHGVTPDGGFLLQTALPWPP